MPSLGRFLTRDTWNGDANRPMSFNRWNYTEGNPINYIGALGNFKAPPITSCFNEGGKCLSLVLGYDEKTKPDGIDFIPTYTLQKINGIPSGINFAQNYKGNKGLCGEAAVTWIGTLTNSSLTLQDVVDDYQQLLNKNKIWKCKTDSNDLCVCLERNSSGSCIKYEKSYDVNYNGAYQMAKLINYILPD